MSGRTLFVSDIHLRPSDADGASEHADRFFDFLTAAASGKEYGKLDAIYILGDLFDYWFEPGGGLPSAFKHHCDSLRDVAADGVELVVLPGNRDFLMGSAFVGATGARLGAEEESICLSGQDVALLHGDTLMSGDRRYLRWMHLSRSPGFRRVSRGMPAWLAERVARYLRKFSSKEKRSKPVEVRRLCRSEVCRRLQIGVDVVIAGHFHEPCDEVMKFGEREVRVVLLGTWDDGVGAHAVWDGRELTLHDR